MPQLEHIDAIERCLWSAADTLRANSQYASNEYPFRLSGVAAAQSSSTGQNSIGMRNAAACSTMPSSIAKARRASRSWNLVKA